MRRCRQARRKQEKRGHYAEGVAGQMGVVGNVGPESVNDVIKDNHFKRDKVYRGNFHCADDIKPVYHRDERLREKHKVRPRDRRDCPACPDDGRVIKKRMPYSAENASRKVETNVIEMAQLVVDVVAEEVQKVHIAEDVH